MVKLGVVIGFFICAILAYRKKRQGRCTPIPILLSLYIFILLGLLILDVTRQFIQGYFFLIFLANFINLTGFMCILKNMPGKPGKVLWSRCKYYFAVMFFLYGVVFVLSFVPGFEPRCTSEKVYPAVLNYTCTLFIINYFFHLYLNCNKKYYLSEDDAEINALLIKGSVNSDKNLSEMTKEEQVAYSHEFHNKMFKKQMDTYLSFQTVLTIINVCIQLLGRVYVDQGHYLGCTTGGSEWIYTTLKGSFFVSGHMVLIIMQAVMLEKALYGVPHHSGWFELPNELTDNLNNEEGDDSESLKSDKAGESGGYSGLQTTTVE